MRLLWAFSHNWKAHSIRHFSTRRWHNCHQLVTESTNLANPWKRHTIPGNVCWAQVSFQAGRRTFHLPIIYSNKLGIFVFYITKLADFAICHAGSAHFHANPQNQSGWYLYVDVNWQSWFLKRTIHLGGRLEHGCCWVNGKLWIRQRAFSRFSLWIWTW